MVLNALTQALFEPLESVHINLLSLRTVLLLALASAKRVGALHALSVYQACLSFIPDDSKVTLLPNPAFVPKVCDSAYNCSALELRAFYPPPFSSSEERKLHTLCPVRALRYYVNRTRSFRNNDQLFVSWATHYKGKPMSSQRLSHWMVEAGPAPRGGHSWAVPPQTSYCAPLPSLLNVINFESETNKTVHIRKRLHALASVSNCTRSQIARFPPESPPRHTHTHTHTHTQNVICAPPPLEIQMPPDGGALALALGGGD